MCFCYTVFRRLTVCPLQVDKFFPTLSRGLPGEWFFFFGTLSMSSNSICDLEDPVAFLYFSEVCGESRHNLLTPDMPSVIWLCKYAADNVELLVRCAERLLKRLKQLWGMLLHQVLQLHSVNISCNFRHIELCFSNWVPRNSRFPQRGVRGSGRPNCLMAEEFLLVILNLCVRIKILVTYLTLIIPSLISRSQSLLQSRSSLIRQSSQSAEPAVDSRCVG